MKAESCGFFHMTDPAHVETAARLCKADLVSGMVGEFPELQGVMGGYYAQIEGLPSEVSVAIADHYGPTGPESRCPKSPVAVAVALADKLDTLVGFWAIDEKPTGSKDPYALRRAALGTIRLITENGLRLKLTDLFKAAAAGREVNAGELLSFFADRLKVQVREQGVRHDLVSAVLALGTEDDLVRLLVRVRALQAFVDSEDGKNLLVAYNRAANIVKAEERKDKALVARIRDLPDSAMFEQAEEKAVAAALASADASGGPALQREDFTTAMSALAALRAPLDAFFGKVTVNVGDRPDLRLNRLRLLRRISATIDRVADFENRGVGCPSGRGRSGRRLRWRACAIRNLKRPLTPTLSPQAGRGSERGRDDQVGVWLWQRHRRGTRRHAQPPGRQGRQPRGNVEHRAAGAAGLHGHHRALHALLRQRQVLPHE